MASPTRKVLLIGKVGHGKTHIFNKICGTTFASEMCAKSCTQSLQSARTHAHGITVIDTPGFYSAEEIASHTANQRMAIEQNEISGIYVVVKFGRSDEMAETLNKIMDFIGDDDIRIIITHNDSSSQQRNSGDVEEIIDRLSELLDVDFRNIIAIGKNTKFEVIENFIASTLHAPRKLELNEVQLASVADLSVGARKYNKDIEEIKARIQAATVACQELSIANQIPERETAIHMTKSETKTMVDDSMKSIIEGAQDLTLEQRHLLNQELQHSVSAPLEALLQATPKYHNKKDIDRSKKRKMHVVGQSTTTPLQIKFIKDKESSCWRVQYFMGGEQVPNAEQVPNKFREKTLARTAVAQTEAWKRPCTKKSNCRAPTSNTKKRNVSQNKALLGSMGSPNPEFHARSLERNNQAESGKAESVSTKVKLSEDAPSRCQGNTQTHWVTAVADLEAQDSDNQQSGLLGHPSKSSEPSQPWCSFLAWVCSTACVCFAVSRARPEVIGEEQSSGP